MVNVMDKNFHEKNNQSLKSITIITGATSGIGEALAYNFYPYTKRILLVGRRKDRLQKITQSLQGKYEEVYYYEADLVDKKALIALKKYVHKELSCTVQHLFNNAGFGLVGDFKNLNLNQQKDMVTLNVMSLMELTHMFMEDLYKHRTIALPAGILNISSVASFVPGPKMAVYFATKAFVTSFSEALRQEVLDAGITVCNYCPGPVRTEFLQVTGAKDESVVKQENDGSIPDATQTANDAIQAYIKKKRQRIQGIKHRVLIFMSGLLPSSVFASIVKNINNKRL